MERAPLFSIPVADLEYGERDLDEAIPVAWLEATLAGTEASPVGEPGRLEVTISKSGREVMVRGHARAAVTLPCARTLDPARYNLTAELFLLLAPPSSASPAPGGRTARRHGTDAAAPPRKAAGQIRAGAGKAKAGGKPGAPARRPGKDGPTAADLEEGAAAAAHDTYDGERVVLDPFVREVLLLELPMFPLREDLRSEATPAIERPQIGPAESEGSAESYVDPRLAPLAALKSRLRTKKE